MKSIIKFHIDSCFHCKRIESTFKELSQRYKGEARFADLKVSYPEQEKEYNLSIYPTVAVYDEKGKEIDRIQGVIPPKTLEKFIEKVVKSHE